MIAPAQNNLTQAPMAGIQFLQQQKTVVGIETSSVLRRTDSRATNAAFSMVRCAGEPQGSPFRKAVVSILCHLATREIETSSGQLNANLRRFAMCEDATIPSIIDGLDLDVHTLSGLMHTLHTILNDCHCDNGDDSKMLHSLALSIEHFIERCEKHSTDIHNIYVKEVRANA